MVAQQDYKFKIHTRRQRENMNGRVRREYVQRLSKNLTNQELGLISMEKEEEEEEENYDSSFPLRSDGKRNRESSAQAEYRKKYNQTLKAVQRNRKTSYKLKRRKIAPSLQNNKKKNNRFRVVSPYFSVDDEDGDDVESEEEEPDMSSSSSTVSRRSLGRMAASKYPISGLLDSLGLPPIGLALGDSSFDVDAIKDLNLDEVIPREDGLRYDDDPASPFGKTWQSKESERQKLLENDLNYRFIYLLAGNVSSSVTKLYDEDRLEDMLLRRMNIRRQMQRIHRIEETKYPQLQQDIQKAKTGVKILMDMQREVQEDIPQLEEANDILNEINQVQKEINDISKFSRGLENVKNLLLGTEEILPTMHWMSNLNNLAITKQRSIRKIRKCAKFLLAKKKIPQLKLDVKTRKQGNLLRVLFVCLAHFVALLWERKGDPAPRFSKKTAMVQWTSIVEDPSFFESASPAWDLTGDADHDNYDYSLQLASLRNIWISYWVADKSILHSGPNVTDAAQKAIHKEFSDWITSLTKRIDDLKKEDKEPIQKSAKELLIELDKFDRNNPPLNLDEWETGLRNWVEEVEEEIIDLEKTLQQLAENIQGAEKTLEEMEIVQPARVKYQHRKGWALSPQHSGHIPLDAKVVAGIEAAMDVMRDVKNELRGARASYIVNVLRAGAEQLQHSALSRAAFAKLVASRMALQEEYFPTTWTRKEQMGRVRLWASSALLSLSNLRWTGTKLVNRQSASSGLYNRILMQPASSLW